MDMDKFDDIWIMFSTYNMDGDFFIMEETVAVNDDSTSISDAQIKLEETKQLPITPTTPSFDYPDQVMMEEMLAALEAEGLSETQPMTTTHTTTLNPKYFPMSADDFYEMFGTDDQAIYDFAVEMNYFSKNKDK